MISKKICTFQKITIFYHRTNDLNLLHFMAALKDGLVDTSNYGPFSISLPGHAGIFGTQLGMECWFQRSSGENDLLHAIGQACP